jgi:hypothetical protein
MVENNLIGNFPPNNKLNVFKLTEKIINNEEVITSFEFANKFSIKMFPINLELLVK